MKELIKVLEADIHVDYVDESYIDNFSDDYPDEYYEE